MTTVLGVLYLVLAAWAFVGAALAQPFHGPVRRWHMFVMGLAVIGLATVYEAPAFVYWTGWAVVIGLALATEVRSESVGPQRLATTVALLSVGFWLPALAFAFQPAYPWSTLFLLAPAMLCTYVPVFRQPCQKIVDTFVVGKIRANTEALKAAEARKEKRAEWLARR